MGIDISAVLLAGGQGSRMQPLTFSIPKVMVIVANKPLLEHNLLFIKKNGIKNVIITVCYLHEKITSYFGNGKKFGMNISYIYEQEPLGTAGSLGLLQKHLKKTFIVNAGDSLRDLSIAKVLEFHKKKKGIGTICTYMNSHTYPKSSIQFNRNRKIISFTERPKKITKFPVWSNASFYIFEPEILTYIPKNSASDFGNDIFPSVITKKKKLYAYIHSSHFIDVGNIVKLEKANSFAEQIYDFEERH